MVSTKLGVALFQLNQTKRNSLGRAAGLVMSILAGPVLLAFLLFAMARPTRAAAYVVTNVNDSGTGSLREAIQIANGSAGADAITFDLTGCPCTVALASRLEITDILTITGPGASQLALDGGNTVQILQTANVPVAISGLTIRNGRGTTGGGIFATGTLSLTEVTLEGNTADYGGGVYALGKVRVIGSVFENNTAALQDGGGIYVTGKLRLSGSLFYNNRTTFADGSGGGAGVAAFGPTIITQTQFISNTSADWGGGAYLANITDTESALLTSVDFISNTATSGGGLFSWYTTTLNMVDFVDNYSGDRGGGLYAGYAGNYPTNILGGQMLRNSGTAGGGFYSGSDFSMVRTQVLSNTARSGNGGGAWTLMDATITNAYFANNTVIINGDGGGIYASGNLTLTHTTLYKNQNLSSAGGGSGTGGNITVVDSQYISNTALGDGGGLLAFGTARITDSGFRGNISGNLGGAISTVEEFLNTNPIGGNPSWDNRGSSIVAQQTVMVTDTVFIRNTSQNSGGAINLYSSTGQVTGGSFEGNQTAAGGSGGAIVSSGTELVIRGTSFFTNRADTTGGAIAANYLNVTGVTFRGNHSGSNGGALAVLESVRITASQFQENSSTTDGGAIFLAGGSGSIVNSVFARNAASSAQGNALALSPSGTLSIQYTTIATPTLAGGSAIFVGGGSVELLNSIVASHTVGILQSAGSVNADYNLFRGNLTDTVGSSITNIHPLTGDPVFFDPALDDYHMGVGSEAVDVGADIGVYTDFDGDLRPQGSGFDVGYDEAAAPVGLTAINDSPTPLGSPTTFTATVTSGMALTYLWDFGDGASGSGSLVAHTYTAMGVYTVTVIAENGGGSLSAATIATVVQPLIIPIYLPVVGRAPEAKH